MGLFYNALEPTRGNCCNQTGDYCQRGEEDSIASAPDAKKVNSDSDTNENSCKLHQYAGSSSAGKNYMKKRLLAVK